MNKSNGRYNRSQLVISETGKNAARERSRVRSLRLAFQQLQQTIPTIPPDTKLSKLDVLILATDYISHLTNLLVNSESATSVMTIKPSSTAENQINNIHSEEIINDKILHPIKKWPMRSRLYAKPKSSNLLIVKNIPSTTSHQSKVSTANNYIESEYNCFVFNGIDQLNNDDWKNIDFNIFNDDFDSLTSLSNFQ